MKYSMRCPKCSHNHILYVALVADHRGGGAGGGTSPAKLAYTARELANPLGLRVVQTESFGELEAGVCRRCGYVEYYVKDPASIPIDGFYVRELVGPE